MAIGQTTARNSHTALGERERGKYVSVGHLPLHFHHRQTVRITLDATAIQFAFFGLLVAAVIATVVLGSILLVSTPSAHHDLAHNVAQVWPAVHSHLATAAHRSASLAAFGPVVP